MSLQSLWIKYMPIICAVINGCTMGVDQSSMNNFNIIPQYTDYFNLDSSLEGLFSASINIGSVVGGFFAAQLIDMRQVGRKGGILVSSLITIVGVILQAAAQNRAMFIVGRIIVGIAVTVNACAAPIYVSEMSKAKDRGFLSGVYMASWYFAAIITTGISLGTYTLSNTWSWRSLSVWQLTPSLLILPMLPFIPESPRFLIYIGEEDKAMEVLIKHHGDGHKTALVELEFEQIKQVLEFEKTAQIGWLDLFRTRGNRWRMWIIFWMGVFSQLCGSNIIGTYLGLFLENAGITSERKQIVLNLCLQCANLVAAVAGSALTEGFGRVPILFWSTVLMAICLFLVGGLQKVYGDGGNTNGTNALIFLGYLFSCAYAFSFTPLCVSYPVEIVNYSIRTKGMAFSQIVTFGFGFFNQYVIPIALDHISYKFYFINGAYNIVQAAIIWFTFAETKGLTLEEIDEKFDLVLHTDVKIGVSDVADNAGDFSDKEDYLTVTKNISEE